MITTDTKCHYCREEIVVLLQIDLSKSFQNVYCVQRSINIQRFMISLKLDILINKKLAEVESDDAEDF